MSYASKFLASRGQDAFVERQRSLTIPGLAVFYPHFKVSMKRTTKATRDPGVRDAAWEGLAGEESALAGGEIMTVGLDKYLVQSVNTDVASGELSFFAVKTNAVLTPQRITASMDADNNIVETWSWSPSGTTVDAFGQVITYSLRQYDPGLLESSRYIFYLPADIGLQVMDRVVLASENLMVNAIDPLMLEGIVRIQAGSDTRA